MNSKVNSQSCEWLADTKPFSDHDLSGVMSRAAFAGYLHQPIGLLSAQKLTDLYQGPSMSIQE